MTIFIGIDPGVKPVFALLDDDYVDGNNVLFSKLVTRRFEESTNIPWLREYLRLEDLRRKLEYRLDKWGNMGDIVFGMEGLAFGAAYRIALMSKVDYVLKCGILRRRYKLIQVAPGTWKKFVGGSGRASKEHVKQCLIERGFSDVLDKPLDYSDALAIALTVRSIHEKSIDNKS